MSIAGLLQTRSLRYSVGLYLLFNSLYLALVLIQPGDPHTFALLDEVGVGLSGLFAVVFCLLEFKTSGPYFSHTTFSMTEEIVHRWAPAFIAMGLFCQVIGQAMYIYYDFNHLAVFPSWADIAYLSMFPFLFIGIISLPAHPSTHAARWCILLDSLIIMFTIVTFAWYFGLGTAILQGKESPLAKGLGSVFPFLDLLLIFSAIQLVLRTHDFDLRLIVPWLILSLLLIVTADGLYDYQTLQHTYRYGWQDVFWPLGYMLLGLSVQAWNIIRNQKQMVEERERIRFPNMISLLLKIRSSKWNALLSYILIPAVGLLMIHMWCEGAPPFLAHGVYFGTIALIGLIVLRQAFISRKMLLENIRLYHMQEQARIRGEISARQETANIITDFLILVNHELRTPLTGIKGNLQLAQHRLKRLKKYYEEGRDQVSKNVEQAQIPLASASQSVQLQERMINAMIDHARIQANILMLSKKLCDLRTIVEAAVARWQQRISEHRIILEILSPLQELPVIADEGRITQVIDTYLTNALNYSPRERPVTVQLSTEDTVARVAVHDDGPGIPLPEQEHLWEYFYRAKGISIQHDLDLSLGLGLYLCREFIKRHNGSIGVQSLPGHGATFWFTLPLLNPEYGRNKEC